jgi:AcrR family transcriptional regulator
MTNVTHPTQPDIAGAADPTAPVAKRARNPRGQGDRLREELLGAAVELLADAPHPDEVSIRAIARAAGVSPTAAYRHFSDRDELLCAAVGTCFEEFAQEMLERTQGLDDPFERLRETGRAYLDYAMAEHGHYRVLFSNPVPMDSGLVDEDSAGKAAFTQLVDIVQSCLDQGAPTRTDDAVFLSFQVWTWIHGIVDLRITHAKMPWPPIEDMFADLQVALGLVRAA